MFVQWKQKLAAADGHVRLGPRLFDTCVHGPKGADRIKIVPFVARTSRDEGEVRHETLWQPGPGIRPCCVEDDGYPMVRVGFWLEVFERAGQLSDSRRAPFRKELLPALDGILVELERVVPRPDDADFDLAHAWPPWRPSRGESTSDYLRRVYASLCQGKGRAGARPRTKGEAGGGRTGARGRPWDRETVTLTAEQAAALLGLGWPCGIDEIKAAFRKAALEHHPDRGGDHDRMVEINAAMEILATYVV